VLLAFELCFAERSHKAVVLQLADNTFDKFYIVVTGQQIEIDLVRIENELPTISKAVEIHQ